MNTSPMNYKAQSTSATIKPYLLQSQPSTVTEEILPTKKKNPHFNNFSTEAG